tara:strand:- start:3674 stop:5218 length:1545 start_codon:yes stop_codon:yes gene_type:complete
MRGGRRYRAAGRDFFIEDFQHIIADAGDCNFSIEKNNFFSAKISEENLRFAMAQHLMLRIGVQIVPRILLYRNGHIDQRKRTKIIGPFPEAMCLEIEKNGYEVNRFISKIFLFLFVSIAWSYGVISSTSQMILGWKSYDSKYANNIYLGGVSAHNLFENTPKNKSFSYLTWLKQSLPEDCFYLHSVEGLKDTENCKYVANPIPNLPDLRAKLRYTLWTIWAIFFSLFKFIGGKWHYAFFLSEAATAKKIDLIPPQLCPKAYYFNSSNMMKKSLWVDVFEARGGRTNLLLYSINIQGFEDKNGKRPYYAIYRNMTWKNICVWNRLQKEYLTQAMTFTPNFQIVGPVWFSDTDKGYPIGKTPSISFFDVTPKRDAWINTMTAKKTYYTRNLCLSSFNEIYKICTEIGVKLLYKHKRAFSSLDNKVFVNNVSKMTDQHSIIVFDPEVSPQKLIEASDAVISLPFTSTGILAQSMGKPACYLDLSAELNKADALANGIPILQSIYDLEVWIKENLPKT